MIFKQWSISTPWFIYILKIWKESLLFPGFCYKAWYHNTFSRDKSREKISFNHWLKDMIQCLLSHWEVKSYANACKFGVVDHESNNKVNLFLKKYLKELFCSFIDHWIRKIPSSSLVAKISVLRFHTFKWSKFLRYCIAISTAEFSAESETFFGFNPNVRLTSIRQTQSFLCL